MQFLFTKACYRLDLLGLTHRPALDQSTSCLLFPKAMRFLLYLPSICKFGWVWFGRKKAGVWVVNHECVPLYGAQFFCCCLAATLCPTLLPTMDCSPPGSFVHGISQARILKWVAMSFSRGSFQPKDLLQGSTHVSCIALRFFTTRAMGKAQCLQVKVLVPQSCPNSLWPRGLLKKKKKKDGISAYNNG